jgi:hypothetical protein
MSKLNSINGGYNGGSPRVRNENSKKPFVDNRIKVLDAQELVDNIKKLYSEGRLTQEGIELISNQLSDFVNKL